MATIDLTTPPEATGALESMPRRLALTLPELLLLAERAGGAPLPFELADAGDDGLLQSRLGQSPAAADAAAYADALAALHDPAGSLSRRGLVDGDVADPGIVGALGLLAAPSAALDLDVVVRDVRVRAWHRSRGNAVATLATADGVVFELAWFAADAWPDELGRVAALPEDHELGESSVADAVLPWELVDAGVEAVRSNRADLLGTIVAHHSGQVLDGDGRPLDDEAATRLVSALVSEPDGRLRALVADVSGGGDVVGVVSWVLLADGWRHLHPRRHGDERLMEVRRVQPADLAPALGPVLTEVTA